MNKEQRLAATILRDKDQYYCWAARPATIQRISILAVAWYKYFQTKILNFSGSGDDTCYYFERAKYEKSSLDLKRHFNSRIFVTEHLRKYRAASRQLLAVGRRAIKIREDRNRLLALFDAYRKAMIAYSPYFITTFSVDDFIFPALALDLKRYIRPDKYDEALKIISSPTVIFGYQKYQQALVKAKTAIDLEHVVEKFRWIKEYSF